MVEPIARKKRAISTIPQPAVAVVAPPVGVSVVVPVIKKQRPVPIASRPQPVSVSATMPVVEKKERHVPQPSIATLSRAERRIEKATIVIPEAIDTIVEPPPPIVKKKRPLASISPARATSLEGHVPPRTEIATTIGPASPTGATRADPDDRKIGGLIGVDRLTTFDFKYRRIIVIGISNESFERKMAVPGRPTPSIWLRGATRRGNDDGRHPCLMIVSALEHHEVPKFESLPANIFEAPIGPESEAMRGAFAPCDETNCFTDDANYIDLWLDRIVETINRRMTQEKPLRTVPFVMRSGVMTKTQSFAFPTTVDLLTDYLGNLRNAMYHMVLGGRVSTDPGISTEYSDDYHMVTLLWQNLDPFDIEFISDDVFRDAYRDMIMDMIGGDETRAKALADLAITPILHDIMTRIGDKRWKTEADIDFRASIREFMVAMWMRVICDRGPLDFPVGCRKPWAGTKNETIVCLVPTAGFLTFQNMFDRDAIDLRIERHPGADGVSFPAPVDLLKKDGG